MVAVISEFTGAKLESESLVNPETQKERSRLEQDTTAQTQNPVLQNTKLVKIGKKVWCKSKAMLQ
jgi:hypothetical protein